jgi:hypothetical protein
MMTSINVPNLLIKTKIKMTISSAVPSAAPPNLKASSPPSHATKMAGNLTLENLSLPELSVTPSLTKTSNSSSVRLAQSPPSAKNPTN